MNRSSTLLLTSFFLFSLGLTAAFSQEVQGIMVRVEVWQMPQLEALKTLEEARGLSDAASIARALPARAEKNDSIKLLSLPNLMMRSGQRSRVQTGQKEYLASYVPDSKGKAEIPKMARYVDGVSFEADAVLGPEAREMDISFSFQYALEPAVIREATMIGPITGKELKIEIVEQNLGDVTTAVSLMDGEVRLAGTIPNQQENASILVFIHAEVLKKPGEQ